MSGEWWKSKAKIERLKDVENKYRRIKPTSKSKEAKFKMPNEITVAIPITIKVPITLNTKGMRIKDLAKFFYTMGMELDFNISDFEKVMVK